MKYWEILKVFHFESKVKRCKRSCPHARAMPCSGLREAAPPHRTPKPAEGADGRDLESRVGPEIRTRREWGAAKRCEALNFKSYTNSFFIFFHPFGFPWISFIFFHFHRVPRGLAGSLGQRAPGSVAFCISCASEEDGNVALKHRQGSKTRRLRQFFLDLFVNVNVRSYDNLI